MLENCYGQHGWREFFTNRNNILSEYDRLISLTVNRPIQVAHGQGVEAFLRKWLSEFLPKKYGVTSGYIIPNLYSDTGTFYHFDIIIYDQLESPILWTEGNEDQSTQGKYRAIPAKHIVSVFEVKSRFTKKNIHDSFQKLNQTIDFKDQLHPYYSCGIIFIELKEEDNKKASIVKELIKGKDVYGFQGGMVLRYEGDHSSTGLIGLFNSKPGENQNNEKLIPLARPIDDLDIYLSEDGNLQVGSGTGVKVLSTGKAWSVAKTYGVIYYQGDIQVHLDWSRTYFSDFCIDLLSNLEGIPFDDTRKPSFGQIFDNIRTKKAPSQPRIKVDGKPFISCEIYKGDSSDGQLPMSNEGDQLVIKIQIKISNIGDSDAIVIEGKSRSKLELPVGESTISESTVILKKSKDYGDLIETLKKHPIEMPYRVIYHPKGSEKDLLALEKNLKITDEKVTLKDTLEDTDNKK